ncbi:hypothetical protein GG851_23645 [Bordetella petrii]|nr:hypothetical protein [Bordetella petrii]
MATDTIDHSTLSRLVEAGVVRGAHVVGQPGGWAVMVKYGTHEQSLAAKNSRSVRVWRRFETLATYLKGMGLTQFDVDAANYDQDAVTTVKRPDRAEALKKTHEAAAYDKWFRGRVEASRNDPRPSISNDEMKAEFAQRRAALRAKAAQ